MTGDPTSRPRLVSWADYRIVGGGTARTGKTAQFWCLRLALGLLPGQAVYQLDVASLGHVARAASQPSAKLRVARTIVLLGCVSCLTDISSEMVASVLPIYLLTQLQFSPLQFGIVDGLYQGVSAIARLASGVIGPFRAYRDVHTVPTEWLPDRANGAVQLWLQTRAWDMTGQRYLSREPLIISREGNPWWR